MSKTIKLPRVTWALGDPEQFTQSVVTRVTRPLYYLPKGQRAYVRVGSVDPDYAERLMNALSKGDA